MIDTRGGPDGADWPACSFARTSFDSVIAWYMEKFWYSDMRTTIYSLLRMAVYQSKIVSKIASAAKYPDAIVETIFDLYTAMRSRL